MDYDRINFGMELPKVKQTIDVVYKIPKEDDPAYGLWKEVCEFVEFMRIKAKVGLGNYPTYLLNKRKLEIHYVRSYNNGQTVVYGWKSEEDRKILEIMFGRRDLAEFQLVKEQFLKQDKIKEYQGSSEDSVPDDNDVVDLLKDKKDKEQE